MERVSPWGNSVRTVGRRIVLPHRAPPPHAALPTFTRGSDDSDVRLRGQEPLHGLGLLASLGLVAALAVVSTVKAQPPATARPPVIDMHVHSTNVTPAQELATMRAADIRFIWLASLATDLGAWAAALDSSQYLPSLTLPCPGGRAAFIEPRCWDGTADFPDLAWLRAEVQAGRIRGLGEAITQYLASPNDSASKLFGSSPRARRVRSHGPRAAIAAFTRSGRRSRSRFGWRPTIRCCSRRCC